MLSCELISLMIQYKNKERIKTKMLNKVLFILLAMTLSVLSATSVLRYEDYKDQRLQEQQVAAQQEAQRKADEDRRVETLQAEVNRLNAECEKGVVAFGLLTETEQEENQAPLCNLEPQIQVVQ